MRRAAVPLAVWVLTLAAQVLSPAARADVVYLKDGSKVEGEVLRKTASGWVVRTPDGKVTTVAVDDVKSFEARRGAGGSAGAGAATTRSTATDEPMRALLSLRRVVDSQTDIPKVLERYRKFVEQYVGTPAGDEALKDLQMWEQRLEQKMVKVGDRWITQEEQGKRQARALERAAAARLLLLQGRFKEATAEIDAALAEDANNAAALYLRGVTLYRQQQVHNARKAFEASAQISGNHGPTFNNIAVIMWGLKQYPGAVNFYGQAMNAAPGQRVILDNVAEALHELPKAQRDNAATKKVVLMFNAQDMTLQTKMKKRGLIRWGSTWVPEKDVKRLEAEEDRIEDRLAALESEFEQVQDRLEQIGRDVADTQRSLRRIEASSYGRDANGRPIRLPYPRLYYDLKRDLEQLMGEQDDETQKKARLRSRAKQVQQDVSVPRYAGVQQIIGVEGAPDLPPLTEAELQDPQPATRPTTAPAQTQEVGANAQ